MMMAYPIDGITVLAQHPIIEYAGQVWIVLLVSMIVGLIISLFQTLTSIQEQTLTFVPKLIAIMIALMIMGNWLLNEIVSFMQML